MKLERISNHHSHPAAAPEHRYASLHRAIEKGLATDETWSELTKVCVEMERQGEALNAYHNVRGNSERFHLQNLLLHHHILREPDRALQRWAEGEDQAGLREDLEEAASFLASDHMAVTLVVTTATFPLVVGLSGYLTSGSPSELVRLVAVIPALLVLIAIGSLARRVLLDSARGFDDVPDLPAPGQVVPEASRFAIETLPTVAMLLGPAAALDLLGFSAPVVAGSLVLGALLLPMAWALRTVRADWAALGWILPAAVRRSSSDYMARAACLACLFAPAFGLLALAGNTAMYLQLALVGPLLVAPMLFASRLMGRFLYVHRADLHDLLNSGVSPIRMPSASGEDHAPPEREEPRPPAHRTKPVFEQALHSALPEATAAARPTTVRQPRTPRPSAPLQPSTPISPVAATSSRRAAGPRSVAQTPPPQTPPPQVAAPPQPESTWEGDPPVDLLSLPGVRLLTGEDRQRAGATPQP